MIAEMTIDQNDPLRIGIGLLVFLIVIVGMSVLWSLTGDDKPRT